MPFPILFGTTVTTVLPCRLWSQIPHSAWDSACRPMLALRAIQIHVLLQYVIIPRINVLVHSTSLVLFDLRFVSFTISTVIIHHSSIAR